MPFSLFFSLFARVNEMERVIYCIIQKLNNMSTWNMFVLSTYYNDGKYSNLIKEKSKCLQTLQTERISGDLIKYF